MSENGMTPAVLDHFLNPRNVGNSGARLCPEDQPQHVVSK